MRIFFSVLIIVLCIMISVRLIALYLNSSGNYNKSEKVIQIVGIIIAAIVGVLALLYMLGVIDISRIIGGFVGILILLTLFMILTMLLFVIVLFVVAPFLLITFGKKRKKKVPIIIAASIWGPLYLSALIFWMIYPKEYPYVDLWMYGKTQVEVIEKYGEPAYFENNTVYYRCDWNRRSGYNYYCLELDEDGEVHKIYEDYYDKTWVLGRTLEEVDARFPWVWPGIYSAPGDSYADYAIEFDENDIAIEFETGEVP